MSDSQSTFSTADTINTEWRETAPHRPQRLAKLAELLDENWLRIEDAMHRIENLERDVAALGSSEPNATETAAQDEAAADDRSETADVATEAPTTSYCPAPMRNTPATWISGTASTNRVARDSTDHLSSRRQEYLAVIAAAKAPATPEEAAVRAAQKRALDLARLRRKLAGVREYRDARATQRNRLLDEQGRLERAAPPSRPEKRERAERGQLWRELGVDMGKCEGKRPARGVPQRGVVRRHKPVGEDIEAEDVEIITER